MLFQWWPTVYDDGPTLSQLLMYRSCWERPHFLGVRFTIPACSECSVKWYPSMRWWGKILLNSIYSVPLLFAASCSYFWSNSIQSPSLFCRAVPWLFQSALTLHTCTHHHHFVASELKDPICHSDECQIGSFSSEATICVCVFVNRVFNQRYLKRIDLSA